MLQFALITLTLRIFISLILEGYRNLSRTSEPFSTVRLTLLRSFRCFASRRTVGVSAALLVFEGGWVLVLEKNQPSSKTSSVARFDGGANRTHLVVAVHTGGALFPS